MKYPNLIRHCYKICNAYMPRTSVIFTEKPTEQTDKYVPFDFKKYKEKQQKENDVSNTVINLDESKKSSCFGITNQCDSINSISGTDESSINLSGNVSNLGYDTNSSLTEKSEVEINVETGSEREKAIKRTDSITNCCAFPDQSFGNSG